ncbi:hypothetical protein D915_002610 [Fasciola hepatica]|uniref:Uncharacterized protein n=1 Tax=Fasciola hepatica TaxID=6192 RepID=A0A4E0RL29_FASHE|nr:hypothetical protein D915_002610 [Fasciola hepatica]
MSGLVILALSGTILMMQLLFWIRYMDSPEWHWPKTMSLIGFGSSTVLFIPAVLLLTTRWSKSRKLLYSAAIFGCVSMLYCLSVGVSNTVDYAMGETQNASVITMGLVNLLAGSFVCAYLFFGLGHFYCCTRCTGIKQNTEERNSSREERTKVVSGSGPVIRLYDWGIASQRDHVTVVGQSSKIDHYPHPSAPLAPPSYQP